MFDQVVVAIIASCIASFAIYFFKSSGLFRYSLDVLDRVLSGKELPVKGGRITDHRGVEAQRFCPLKCQGKMSSG